jgi:hypothetical protein
MYINIINTIPYDKVTLLDIVGEGAFHQVYRGLYINIINTIPYDKVTLLDIVGECAFHQVYRGMCIKNNEHYTL